jgi:hypothetical protein
VEEHEADHLNNRLDAGWGKDVEQVCKHFHFKNGSKQPLSIAASALFCADDFFTISLSVRVGGSRKNKGECEGNRDQTHMNVG